MTQITDLPQANTPLSSGDVTIIVQGGVLKQTGVLNPIAAVPAANITGTLGVGSGGTGVTSYTALVTALLPSQSGNADYVLTTDGNNNLSWSARNGTVTSVAIAGNDGLTIVSGSPITGAGTITLGLGNITPTTVNGLTLAEQTDGFTIYGGSTTPDTLTITSSEISNSTLTLTSQTNGFTLLGGATTATLTVPASVNTSTLLVNSNNLSDVSNTITARTNLGLGSMATQNSTSVSITGGSITGMQTPVNATDVANKSYVDSIAAGLDQKQSCVVATTTNLTATYANGASGVGATLTATVNGVLSIDGYASLAVNDRVLVKDQTTAYENGIFVATDLGSASTPWILTRATDYDTSAEIVEGTYSMIDDGTTNKGYLFIMTTNGTVTVGTTGITFSSLTITPFTIDGLTALGAAPAVGDELPLYNLIGASNYKITVQELFNALPNLVSTTISSLVTDVVPVWDGTSTKYSTVGALYSGMLTNQTAVTSVTTPASSYIGFYDGDAGILGTRSITLPALTLTLSDFVGDTGAGGTKGLVPAPAAGDAALDKVLGAGGSFVNVASLVGNVAVTLTANAATLPITSAIDTVTNNSAATMTLTLATTGATDGQKKIVRIYDYSAVAQTISWVNTENSGITVPTTSNGSTTLPLEVTFRYNGSTSKWRCNSTNLAATPSTGVWVKIDEIVLASSAYITFPTTDFSTTYNQYKIVFSGTQAANENAVIEISPDGGTTVTQLSFLGNTYFGGVAEISKLPVANGSGDSYLTSLATVEGTSTQLQTSFNTLTGPINWIQISGYYSGTLYQMLAGSTATLYGMN